MKETVMSTWKKYFSIDREWHSKAHRNWFYFCWIFLSIYLAYVLFAGYSTIFWGTVNTLASLVVSIVFVFFVAAVLLGMCKWFLNLKSTAGLCKGKISWKFFCISMGISIIILGCALVKYYPGGATVDSLSQWRQLQTGNYVDWHPVFHTLLLWVAAQVVPDHTGVVVVQMLCFAIMLAHFLSAMESWGIRKSVLLVFQCFVLSYSIIQSAMVHAWKDNAMTIGALWLCTQGVNLYFSNGKWIEKKSNAILMGLALAFTTMVRHNALLFTFPLLACGALYVGGGRWKNWLITAGVMGLCLALVWGPLYTALDVEKPVNKKFETMGIPMTIMLDARTNEPERLDRQTMEMLQGLCSDEMLSEKYFPGLYNSIKFSIERADFEKIPLTEFARATISTIIRAPRSAFDTINNVTSPVWSISGENKAWVRASPSMAFHEGETRYDELNRVGARLDGLLSLANRNLVTLYLFQNIGPSLAIVLLCGLMALYRQGVKALFFCFPVLIYNFGTMLLLSDNDVRLFQFSIVLCLPMALILWTGARAASSVREEKKYAVDKMAEES